MLLFAAVALYAFLYTLPGETIVSPIRSALVGAGLDFRCESAAFVFPFGIRCGNARIAPLIGESLAIDTVTAGFELTGLFRWLPFHLKATKGAASLDIRSSPYLLNPRKVRLRLAKIGTEDVASLLPASPDTGFLVDSADLLWNRSGNGSVWGTGEGYLEWIRFPIPAPDSPVREATLRNVRLKFVVRQGNLMVSSLTGTYEGSEVEGTGEIARFLTPSLSEITFHLRIRNPMEGKVATLFNLVAKNAKNANLRISGTLQAPAGEFHFF